MSSASTLTISTAGLHNVAVGKQCQQSSTSFYNAEGGAGAGCNGSITGKWSVHTNIEPTPPWWMVDLETFYEIDLIVFYNRDDPNSQYAGELTFSLSCNGIDWTDVYRGVATLGGIVTGRPLIVNLFSKFVARYVKITRLGNYPLVFDETQVFVTSAALRKGQFVLDYQPNTVALRDSKCRPNVFVGIDLLGSGDIPASARPTALIVRRYGRFGNNVIQLLNAVRLALHLGIHTLYIADLALPLLTGEPEQTNAGIRFVMGRTTHPTGELAIASYFWDTSAFWSDGHPPSLTRELFTTLVRPLFVVASSPSQHATITVHIRSGDIFSGNVHPTYAQPPLSYYKMAIADAATRLGDVNVVVVYEDRLNPCVNALEAHLKDSNIPYIFQSGTIENDIQIISNATTLISGHGTFVSAAALLGSNVTLFYSFRSRLLLPGLFSQDIVAIIVEDVAGNYIPSDSWLNTAEQLELMTTYSIKDLALRSV